MLEALDLAGHRGSTCLFSGLSFRVLPGTALIVGGRNGTGKTTLLRMLAGLTAPTAGEVRWRGSGVGSFAPAMRNDVLFAGHAAAVKDDLTAEENLASLVALGGDVVTRDAIRRALDDVALGAQRGLPARVLSAGQRRRIGLARLRVAQRALWLLDEPLTALDAAGSELLASSLKAHVERGGVAVAATHQPIGLATSVMQTLTLGGTD